MILGIVLWTYLGIGAVLAGAAISIYRHMEKRHPGEVSLETRTMMETYGAPFIAAGIILIWPALIIISRRK